MSGIVQDLRSSLRALRKSPATTSAAVLMLALGIGSSTAIFSIVQSVLMRPLPYRDSERIMSVSEVDENGRRMNVSTLNFLDWRSQSRSLEAMTALSSFPATIASNGRTQRGSVAGFHGEPLAVYGFHIAVGRAFTGQETQSGAPAVAVVSNDLAKRLWDKPGDGVGKTLDTAGMSLTVIGVIEPTQDERTDVFLPAAVFGPDQSTRTAHNWRVVARLRPAATLEQAQTEMRVIGERLYEHYRGENNAATVEVTPLLALTVEGVRPVLLALLGAGGLLILIACANVANLLLAQSVTRRREMAIRQTLGAARWRLARQLLLESVVLALLAGAAGTVLAQWSFTSLLHLIPGNLPRRPEISMDSTALGFAFLVSVAAGVLFGLAPALRTPRNSLALSLKEQGRTSTGGDAALRKAFVVGEFALALALLSCAGLLVKSFVRLLQVDPGFQYEHVLLAETELPSAEYRKDADLIAFWRQMLARLATSPDIESAGVTNMAPLDGFRANGTFEFLDEPGRQGYAWYGVATSGFFQALKVPLVRGRLFEESDVPQAPPVAVVNETAVRKFWPHEDPLGKRVRWIGMDRYDDALTIVGVIGDVRHRSLKQEADPEIYVDFFQRPARARDADLLLSARTDEARLPGLLREQFKTADATLPVRFQTMAAVLDNSLLQPRFQMLLFGFFAACAMLLSAVGLFSAVAYAVSRQTREIGIRLALGATPESVRGHVLRDGMRTTLLGVLLGALLALGAGRMISSLLFGVREADITVFAAAAALLAVSALFACYLPARRASRVDPMEALRYE